MQLVLGVHDVAYAAQFHTKAGTAKKGKSKAQLAYGAGKSTGEIALILEKRYNIMRTFVNMESTGIIAAIEKSMVGSVINMVAGQPGAVDPSAQAMSDIATTFKDMLSKSAFDGRTSPGRTPTEAARRGVSHRFKRPYARRPSRPSFIDTGLYQSSFTAWTE